MTWLKPTENLPGYMTNVLGMIKMLDMNPPQNFTLIEIVDKFIYDDECTIIRNGEIFDFQKGTNMEMTLGDAVEIHKALGVDIVITAGRIVLKREVDADADGVEEHKG